MRAVLSARSRKVPSCVKKNASSCNAVPIVTPRDRCERNFTHSKSAAGLLATWPWRVRSLNSSHVSLIVSHHSVVSVPRTARAFSRAACRHA
jgi:hypothetical protein